VYVTDCIVLYWVKEQIKNSCFLVF